MCVEEEEGAEESETKKAEERWEEEADGHEDLGDDE